MGGVLSKCFESDSLPLEIDLEFNIACCAGRNEIIISDSEDDEKIATEA